MFRNSTRISLMSIVSNSNQNAMKGRHQYPVYEPVYFEECATWREVGCSDATCFCRKVSANKGWFLKSDLSFEVFLENYANLWVRGLFTHLRECVNSSAATQGRMRNAVPVLKAIRDGWNNWDGTGKTLPEIVNSVNCTMLCSESYKNNVVKGVYRKLRLVDGTGVYSSKAMGQLFPDLCVPFDTASNHQMRHHGYAADRLGASLQNDVFNFMQRQGLSASDFRKLDDAPTKYWPRHPRNEGEFTNLSRVVDKVFYNQK